MYSTSDLGLASALLIKYQVESLDFTNPKRIVFHFDDTPELLAGVDDYFTGRMQVSAIEYFTRIKQTKTLLYQSNSRYLFK